MMTHIDYLVIANAFKNMLEWKHVPDNWKETVSTFVAALAQDFEIYDPNFDKNKFYRNAGVR